MENLFSVMIVIAIITFVNKIWAKITPSFSKYWICYNMIAYLAVFPPASNVGSTLFHRWINVVSTLWINVEITLIWRWKWNKIRCRIFDVAQRWCYVGARRWNNVKTTLHNIETTLHNVGTTLIQRFFNLASTLVKAILNPIRLVMIMDLKIDE